MLLMEQQAVLAVSLSIPEMVVPVLRHLAPQELQVALL